MKTPKDLLPPLKNGQSLPVIPTTTTKPPIFSDQEKDLAGYFFLRLRNIYGNSYDARYPDDEAVRMAKREYAKQIGQHTRDKLHAAFEELKRLKQGGRKEYQFPDPDLVLGLIKTTWRAYLSLSDPNHPDYQAPALEDLSKKDDNVKTGNETFSNLKDLWK